jgi:transglutaminase-like putative cysteine protease
MRRLAPWLTLAMLTSPGLAATNAVAQQQSPCRSADTLSAELIDMVTKYTTTTEPDGVEARDSLGLPSVPANQVVLVTKRSTCSQAAQAYAAQLTVNTGTLSGRVYLVKAGNTYIVYDPEYVYSDPDAWIVMIFDGQFHLLSMPTG